MHYLKTSIKKLLIITLSLLCLLCFSACSKSTDNFNCWNEDAESLQTLINYVEDVTNEDSTNFIPIEDRIAVFDMDGTLIEELAPGYISYLLFVDRVEELGDQADEDMKRVVQELKEDLYNGTYHANVEDEEIILEPKVFAGMTTSEFNEYVNNFLNKPVEGFNNMTYGQSAFKPMLEVVDYLNKNNFTVYLCSGTDRYICRAILNYAGVNIDDSHVIGSDVLIEVSGDVADSDNVYTPGDEFIRGDYFVSYNWNDVKVTQIIQEIGKQPVLTFGNSGGDKSMCLYTINNNQYKAEAFMVLADDDVRDYGDPIKANEKHITWEECGFNVISMQNDFKTIYGENVVKIEQ